MRETLQDRAIGPIVAGLLIAGVAASLVILAIRGAAAGDAARSAISWAFAAAGLVVGTKPLSSIPLTSKLYAVVLAVAALICCSRFAPGMEFNHNFWEDMDPGQVVAFLAPPVTGFLAGLLIQVLRPRR